MKRLSGFSLMEMMVVLLIVAVVAAASAPMIARKTLIAASDKSPWVWTTTESIAYNLKGGDMTATIGDVKPLSYPSETGIKAAQLSVISSDETKPAISFGKSGGFMKLLTDGHRLGIINKGKLGDIGEGSVAIGPEVTSGKNSVAIGAQIKANDNSVVIGRPASQVNADKVEPGAQSVVIGFGASAKGASVVIGNEAKNNSGIGAVAIGNTAEAGQSAVAIGTGAKAKGENSVAIGNNTIVGHNNSIGIGCGATGVTKKNQIVLGGTSTTVYIPGNLVVGKYAVLNSSGTARIWMDGNAGGDDFGWLWFRRGENMRLDETALSSTSFKDYSDRRLKNVGKAFTGGLEEIKKLEVFNFTFKKDPDKTPRVGVMAQDLQKIFPNAVFKGDDGFLRIRMEDMFYAVVNAVKELDSKIEALKNQEILTLKNRVDKLEKENKALEKRLSELEKKLK